MHHFHFGEGIRLSTKSNWAHYVQYYLVSEMNSEKSFLNKKSLRVAYQYYKDIEAGKNVSSENISHDCVLWLTCVIGDLKPLKSLGQLKTDLNQTIPNTGFSPLMMAANCGNRDVFIYLIRSGAFSERQLSHTLLDGTNIIIPFFHKVDFHVEEGSSSLMHIVINRKHFDLANELLKKKYHATDSQRKKISEGLKTLVRTDKPDDSVVIAEIESQTLTKITHQLSVIEKTIIFLSEKSKIHKPDVLSDKDEKPKSKEAQPVFKSDVHSESINALSQTMVLLQSELKVAHERNARYEQEVKKNAEMMSQMMRMMQEMQESLGKKAGEKSDGMDAPFLPSGGVKSRC